MSSAELPETSELDFRGRARVALESPGVRFASELLALAEGLLLEAIGEALSEGLTWADIGQSLMTLKSDGGVVKHQISRQGARNRFHSHLLVIRSRLGRDREELLAEERRLASRISGLENSAVSEAEQDARLIADARLQLARVEWKIEALTAQLATLPHLGSAVSEREAAPVVRPAPDRVYESPPTRNEMLSQFMIRPPDSKLE